MARILETDPAHGATRITSGRELLGLSRTVASCYRVGSTLIDAGSPNCVPAMLELLDGEITHVLLTHAHEDHVGAAAALAEQGATVLAPDTLIDALTDPPALPTYRRWSWGEPEPVHAGPLGKAVKTPDGRFEVVPTPGHSPYHVALHEPEHGWLFSGDAFLGPRTELRYAESLEDGLTSLERMRALDADVLFPGHGRVRTDVDEALTSTVQHYESLAREARTRRREGASVSRIRRELLGREGFLYWYSRGEFSKENLIRELLTLPQDRAGLGNENA